MEPQKMEMKNVISICNKVDSLQEKQMKQIEIVSFATTVDVLAERVAKLYNIEKNTFDIVCFGKPLDPEKTLDFYEMENGTVIYLLKRKSPASVPLPSESTTSNNNQDGDEMSDDDPFPLSLEKRGMCIALKSALLSPAFYQLMENLTEFEKRENLMALNPELRNDPTLFGVLSDWELLNSYIDKDNLRNVLKRFPHFLEVASHVSASFHEEMYSVLHRNLSYQGSTINYSIDAISEDEEIDESETSSVSSTNTNSSVPRFNDASMSFTSMLMQAYQNQNRQSQSSNVISNNSIITPSMLRQALQSTSSAQPDHSPSCDIHHQSPMASAAVQAQQQQQATESESAPAPLPPQPSAPPQPDTRTPAQILIGWAPQLRQMQELGITDNVVAIQALEATNGDIQAALNIIFSDID